MKRIFTFAIALMSLFAMQQKASALVYTVTVPAGTNACVIAGNFPAPMNWAPDNAGGKMTKVDATHYTITLANTDETMKYKYCSGPDWAYVEKNAGGTDISDRTYSAADVVEKWAMTWVDVPALPLKLTVNVLTPVGTVECYIVGNFAGFSWKPDAPVDSCKMVKTADTPDGVFFSKTVYTADANKLQFHFCSGPAWAYEQDPATNFLYTGVNPADVIVTKWKAIYDPSKLGTINIKATVPAGTGDNVWIQGDFIGWNFDGKGAGGVKGTKNLDGTFSFAVPNVMAINYRLYNRPDWGFPESSSPTAADELPARVANYPADANLAITVAGWKQAYNTGVQELSMDNYKIYTNNNKIVVEGVVSSVELFNLDGRRVQSANLTGTFTSQTLNKGLYVVRVDGATKKISVN